MQRKILLSTVAIVALGLNTSALALAPMGAPTAGLKTGQVRSGFDYSISEQDIKIDWSGDWGKELWRDVQSNLFAANIGYGVVDDWEVFVRLGVADADFDEYEYYGETVDYDFSGDYGFLFGIGTKLTWAKQENLDWGALFQIHWWDSKDTVSGTEVDEVTLYWEEKTDVDIYEIQVAIGPTWHVNDALSIYGGPFFQFIGGEVDIDWSETDGEEYTDSGSQSGDLKEESYFGGYVGALWDIDPASSVFAEFQFTGDAWAFGTGIGWKF